MIMHAGGCPVLVVNRIAYAIAGGFWGGRDLERMAKWSLGASDFPRTTREEFERFIPHSDPAYMEKRPAWTKILAVWTDQAHRSITTFCLFYGQDHERERRGALRRLVQLNLDDPNQWTEGDLFAIWEELHWDWWDGIRLIAQRALHDLRNQNPTEEEFRLWRGREASRDSRCPSPSSWTTPTGSFGPGWCPVSFGSNGPPCLPSRGRAERRCHPRPRRDAPARTTTRSAPSARPWRRRSIRRPWRVSPRTRRARGFASPSTATARAGGGAAAGTPTRRSTI